MKVSINNSNHLDEFIRLNEEWISRHFSLEKTDIDLAKNPHSIIDNGGYVFSLVSKNKVLGVCALFYDGFGIYELARMAVSTDHQKKGYADLLLKSVFETLADKNVKKLYLVSNTKLIPAITLYKKHGFITVYEGPHPVYLRANIIMEYPVEKLDLT